MKGKNLTHAMTFVKSMRLIYKFDYNICKRNNKCEKCKMY